MTKIPIVFTFDKRILLGAAVSIKSLINTALADTSYEIFILHPDLSKKLQSYFTELVKDTCHTIKFIKVADKRFKGLATNKKSWTEVVYYKFLIPELLKDYEKVIYSDVDVCFMQDMTEVYNTDLTEYEFAAVRAEENSIETKNHKYFPENNNKYIFWTGFMVINLKKMRAENTVEKLFKTARDFSARILFYDLDTINITCDKIKPIDFKYVTLESIYELTDMKQAKEYEFLSRIYNDAELTEAKNSPAIVHYAGDMGKPWRRKNIPSYYQAIVNEIPNPLRKLTFRDLRKKLFSSFKRR